MTRRPAMAGCSALLLSILLLLSVTAQAATIPSTAVVANAKIALGQLIASNPGSFIPGFVRLAFHDCVSPKCDACVDLASPDNRGLDARVTALNGLYNSRPDISATMSRADFWMLASVVAVEQGNNGNGVPGLAMRFGRDSSTSCPSSEAGLKFPRAHGNSTETFGFFATNFGFTKSEVVALMGMHSLGRTNAQNTGFTFGPWVINAGTNPTRVINAYYRNLAGPVWDQRDATPTGAERHWQWVNGGPPSGMLNSDVALLKDFRITDGQGRASCPRINGLQNACPDGATAPLVRQFANDNTAWMAALGPVFTKMIEHGYPTGTLTPVDGAVAPLPGTRQTSRPAPPPTRAPAPTPPPARPTPPPVRPPPGPGGPGGGGGPRPGRP